MRGWQRPFEAYANLLTMRSGTRTLWIMLLYTNKANNVFGFVDESFEDRAISLACTVFPQCQIHRQPPIDRRFACFGKHPLK